MYDEPASGTHGVLRVLNPVLPEMLPLVPTFTLGMTGPKPIVTAGMLPVTGGVTLLPLASFRIQISDPIVEPPPLTRGLMTATHIVPSVLASLVVPPNSDLGTPGLCVMNVNTGTTAFETVYSVPTTEVSATTKQPQDRRDRRSIAASCSLMCRRATYPAKSSHRLSASVVPSPSNRGGSLADRCRRAPHHRRRTGYAKAPSPLSVSSQLSGRSQRSLAVPRRRVWAPESRWPSVSHPRPRQCRSCRRVSPPFRVWLAV